MLLILTNSQDVTADYLASVLESSHVPYLRLDTDSLVPRASVTYRLPEVEIELAGRSVKPSDIDHVWYRRPEPLRSPSFDSSPESKYALDEWAEALEGFLSHIPRPKWMNHPAANSSASHKLEQLTTAHSIGCHVPPTLVTQDEKRLREFFGECNQRVVVKPMASGYIERAAEDADSLIYTNRVTVENLGDLSDLTHCPTLFQKFIEKSSDVRITVVDAECHAVEIIAREPDGSQRCDVRRNNMADVEYRAASLPPAVEACVYRLTRHYGLRFAAIDMVVGIDDEWYFLEINPNGQWAWLDLSGGLNIAASFVRSFGAIGRQSERANR